MRFSRQHFHQLFYTAGAGLLLGCLPLSHFAMGLITFLLLLNWIAEWNWREKWERLRANRAGLIFPVLFVGLCLSLIRTDDWNAAGQQLLSNLVIFFGPLIIITSKPFSDKEMRWLYHAFMLGTLIGVVVSLAYWLTHEVREMRNISIFIDHIRFSLCIVLTIVFSVKFLVEKTEKTPAVRYAYAANALLMVAYLFLAQTLTGIVILMVLVLAAIFHLVLRKHFAMRNLAIGGLLLILVVFAVNFTVITYRYFHDFDTETESVTTSKGNPYYFANDGFIENGHRVNDYLCREELEEAWALRSDSSFNTMIEATLVRYLNSKGLHKDYDAVMSLSEKDIRNVEQKIANVEYTKPFGLKRALYQTYFSITLCRRNPQSVQGSSLMQRLEFWKASWVLVRENWLLGVGLGDQKAALDQQLRSTNFPVSGIHERGCHNQFLTYWLIGGVMLVAYFVFLFVYSFLGMRRRVSFVFVALVLILFCSMLVEDTIDSQTGRLMFSILVPAMLFNEDCNKRALSED